MYFIICPFFIFLFGKLNLILYIYKMKDQSNQVKGSRVINREIRTQIKQHMKEHLKFAFTVVSLLSAWCAAIVWLATLGN